MSKNNFNSSNHNNNRGRVQNMNQTQTPNQRQAKSGSRFVKPEIISEYKMISVSETAMRRALVDSLNNYLPNRDCRGALLSEVSTSNLNNKYKFDVAIDGRSSIFANDKSQNNKSQGYENTFQRLLKQQGGEKRITLADNMHDFFKSLEYNYPDEKPCDQLKFRRTSSGKVILILDFFKVLALLFNTPYDKINIYEVVKDRKGKNPEKIFMLALVDSEEVYNHFDDVEFEMMEASQEMDEEYEDDDEE